MTHEYQISGITCAGCVAKVKTQLEKIPGVTTATVGLDGKVEVTMHHHIATSDLQGALQDFLLYQLSEAVVKPPVITQADEDIQRSFLETYKPILLVFG